MELNTAHLVTVIVSVDDKSGRWKDGVALEIVVLNAQSAENAIELAKWAVGPEMQVYDYLGGGEAALPVLGVSLVSAAPQKAIKIPSSSKIPTRRITICA